ncbi:hypothetical protein [Terasakiella pusilla]|jgi:outer membrane protein assembly factor BamE (lipoprotein component of BamABCDE complex)|uniref:hypothetical protein n=1 Tax=Terasakiella pusilla TaxID=64973 RepID=UPI000A067CCC|nr:hypothetical protein [Terasakiella pusilla]
MKNKLLSVVGALVLLTACQTTPASVHEKEVTSSEQTLTLGTVQRHISIGMPSSKVIEALGSPNIVTLDEERREVWVYDKMSSTQVHSNSSSGGNAWVIIGTVGESQSASATKRTQSTLTIVIKLDKNSKVRDFTYHSSRF